MIQLGRAFVAALASSTLVVALFAAEPDLSEYRTVEQAIAAKIARAAPIASSIPGFFGVHAGRNGSGASIVDVAGDSPAARGGRRGVDLGRKIDCAAVKDERDLSDRIHARAPGESLVLALMRDGKPIEVKAIIEPLSRPMAVGRQRAILGVQVETVKDGEGVRIEQVTPDSAADRAKLKVGEIILKVDDMAVPTGEKLTEILNTHKPDDQVTLTMLVA